MQEKEAWFNYSQQNPLFRRIIKLTNNQEGRRVASQQFIPNTENPFYKRNQDFNTQHEQKSGNREGSRKKILLRVRKSNINEEEGNNHNYENGIPKKQKFQLAKLLGGDEDSAKRLKLFNLSERDLDEIQRLRLVHKAKRRKFQAFSVALLQASPYMKTQNRINLKRLENREAIRHARRLQKMSAGKFKSMYRASEIDDLLCVDMNERGQIEEVKEMRVEEDLNFWDDYNNYYLVNEMPLEEEYERNWSLDSIDSQDSNGQFHPNNDYPDEESGGEDQDYFERKSSRIKNMFDRI